MLEKGEKPSDRRLGEGVRDSSATSCSTIEAQKGCRMQEGDAGTKSLYIPPIRPLSESHAT
jgi:hypothetical protein